ncbi:hypothetical protein D3C72_868310 [compost metagenome]
MKPVAQRPAAHRRGAGVQQREQRRRLAAAQRFRQLQVASRGRIEADKFRLPLDGHALHVTQRLALGGRRVVQQRAGRAQRRAESRAAERLQARHADLLAQPARAGVLVEMPFRQPRPRAGQRRQVDAIGKQQFGGADPFEFAAQLRRLALHQPQLAAGEVQPGEAGLADAAPRGLLVHRHQEGVDLVRQQRGVGQRAGGDDAHHLALHRALARGRIADLLADRHRLAQLDELDQVLVDRMERDAGHADRHAAGLSARRQRDVQQPRGLLGVVMEQLVEVAHPIEQQRVRMIRLDAEVLLHHRRVLLGCAALRGGLGVRRGGGVSRRRLGGRLWRGRHVRDGAEGVPGITIGGKGFYGHAFLSGGHGRPPVYRLPSGGLPPPRHKAAFYCLPVPAP